MFDSPNIPLCRPAAELGTLAAFSAPDILLEGIWEVEVMPRTWGKGEGGRKGKGAELKSLTPTE